MARDNLFGEYFIHRHLENFVQAGIKEIKDVRKLKNDNFSETKNIIRKYNDKIQNTYKKKGRSIEIKELSEAYKKLLFDENVDQKTLNLRKAATEAFQQVLNDKFKDNAPKVINLIKATTNENNSADIEYAQLLRNLKIDISKPIRKLDNTYRVTVNTLREYKKQLDKILNATINNTEFADSEKIRNFIKKQDKDIESIKRKVDRIINEMIRDSSSGRSQIRIRDKEGEYKKNIVYLNQIIEDIGQIPILPSSSNVQGMLGELTAGLLNFHLRESEIDFRGKTEEEIREMCGVIGDQSTKVIYSGLLNGNIEKSSNTVIKNNTMDVIVKNHTNKTDVNIVLKNGELLKATVKNYSNYNHVTLVDNTPLSDLLLWMDSSRVFASHYANLMIEHLPDEKNIRNYTYADFDEVRRSAQDIVTQAAIINGFEGYDLQNKPNIFVAFDSSKKGGEVHVYNLHNLINLVLNSPNSRMVKINDGAITAQLKEFASIKANPEYGKTNADMAVALHSKKLHVVVDFNSLFVNKKS